MKIFFLPLFLTSILFAEESGSESYPEFCYECGGESCQQMGEFQPFICDSEPDWSELKDESDWPSRRGDPFVEALRGN